MHKIFAYDQTILQFCQRGYIGIFLLVNFFSWKSKNATKRQKLKYWNRRPKSISLVISFRISEIIRCPHTVHQTDFHYFGPFTLDVKYRNDANWYQTRFDLFLKTLLKRYLRLGFSRKYVFIMHKKWNKLNCSVLRYYHQFTTILRIETFKF